MPDGLRPAWSGAPGGRREWATLYQRAPPGRNRKARNRATFQLPATAAPRSSMLVDSRPFATFGGLGKHFADPGSAAFRQRPLQRHVKHFLDPLDRDELQFSGDVLRDLRHVLAVVLGDDDGPDAATQRRQQLLLEPADLGDLAAQ